MAAPSVIVSFEEARRNARASSVGKRMQAQRQSARTAAHDSHNLSQIFKLDFSDDGSGLTGGPHTSPAASAPRQAIFSAADFADDAPTTPRANPFAGLGAKISAALFTRSKAAAERAFNKQYGGGSGGVGSAGGTGMAAAGPRAALYTGAMGSKQKKAARMQTGSGIVAGNLNLGFSLPSITLPKVSATFKRNATIAALVFMAALLFGSIYTPAQQYYQQIRERDRLSAEYAAVQARNNALQATVDRLSTTEGLEDKAHAEFGYIKEGEQTASVIGIKPVNHIDLKANIPPGSIPAPDTWYSGILDVIFFYHK